MAAKCLICKHQHPRRTADALSCGMCKTCGMVLSGKRMTIKHTGKAYSFCCSACSKAYKRIASIMKKKLSRGEITEKEFQDFEKDVVI